MPTKKKSNIRKRTVRKKAIRRTPKRLSHTLYAYVEPVNGKYARVFGKRKFKSFSNYLDWLIALDRKYHFSTKTWGKKKISKRIVKGSNVVALPKRKTSTEVSSKAA